MKLAASGGRAGGQQGRAAKQGSEPQLFIAVFITGPTPRLFAIVHKHAAGAPFHSFQMYLARAQDTLSERFKR